ncbi:MAG: hypothetical protein KO318_07175 [Methanobacterium sp.]|uniref:hypothetical protein n=1 Tax=Methanobacterium sp. TaxID=2164 RepID=UPI00258E565C|nr:hypothetical protein [Methanobacterium sp.]MCC7560193.1 hypothetical protein [Methanobacterium sp.]
MQKDQQPSGVMANSTNGPENMNSSSVDLRGICLLTSPTTCLLTSPKICNPLEI